MAERGEGEYSSEESGEDLEANGESILAALNFVLILASLSSSDPDERRPDSEGIEERESGSCDQRGKKSGSRSDFPARSQQQVRVSGFSRGALERQQNFKVQSKMRDCRHSRRL